MMAWEVAHMNERDRLRVAIRRLEQWKSLGHALIENDPNQGAADGVICLDAWRKEAARLIGEPNEDGWTLIKDLPDKLDTQIILWNPCDGIHLADACATEREIDELRSGAVFTHWMRIERPKVQK